MSDRVTVKEAAGILGFEKTGMVNYYLRTEQLSAVKEGRNNMIPRAEVEALKERLSSGKKRVRKAKVSKSPASREVVSAQSVESVAPPPTPVAPPMEVLTEVPVRSVIELGNKAAVWKMDPDVKKWESVTDAVALTVTVVERKDNAGAMFLMCKASGSQSLWSIAEADVLSGNFRLLQTPVVTPQTPPVVAPTPSVAPVVETTASEPSKEEQEAVEAAMTAKIVEMERKAQYGEAVAAYAAANDLKLATADDFRKVSKEFRDIIWDYLMEFGEESEEGKNDKVVRDFGHKAILTFTPGRPVVQHDSIKIVSWALENNHPEILTYSIDVSKWDTLKETGVVSPSFIAEVETVKKTDDVRKLVVNKLKAKKDE